MQSSNAVIPRLAERAEGPLKRSIASAKFNASTSEWRVSGACVCPPAPARSLAVSAARDDSAFARFRLHPSATLVEFVARDDRVDVLAGPGEIDVVEERSRGHGFGVFAACPTQGAAGTGVVFRERERHWVSLILPMLTRAV